MHVVSYLAAAKNYVIVVLSFFREVHNDRHNQRPSRSTVVMDPTPTPAPLNDVVKYSEALDALGNTADSSFRIDTRENGLLERLLYTPVVSIGSVEPKSQIHINASKLLAAVRRLNRVPAAFYPPDDDQLGTAPAVASTTENNANIIMPFSFVRTGVIPDEEFDELAERVFGTVRNYEGPVKVAEIWPAAVWHFLSPDEFSSALEVDRTIFAVQMELTPLRSLLRILFPDDVLMLNAAPAPGVAFFAPQTRTDRTLFSTETNRFPVCVEVKTGSIKKFIHYLEGSVTEEPPFYERFCQQLLVHLITYATNRVVITDGRWYAVVEISDEPKHIVHLPIRCKSVDSFSTDVRSLTPTVLLLYCALRSRDNFAKEQELIPKVRKEVHYKKMVRMFRCDAKFEDIERIVLESKSISVISRSEVGHIAFPHKVIWLKFDYDYQKPLNFTILQEGDYNSKVLQIGRDLFPDFFEEMSSIPAEADTVILKVYDEFMLKNPRHELAFGFESPEQFFMYQLSERYVPEVASLKYIEGHNNANPGNQINAPKLYDCGQLEMVLDDSNDYVWRILASGCFLLVEYVHDCGDSAFTQLSLTTGLEQIEMLSKLGIRHLDIKRSNTRVQSDGTIFLMDYSHVKLYDPQNLEECSSSFESMKKSFLSMMKGLGFEMPPVTDSEV